ncbi:DUF4224 domain-containing protein [Leptospira sp. 96542]|nr:DUF4224 domain-containing protein [Leptospira sp. 96542]
MNEATGIALQIMLPAEPDLSPEQIARITGRDQVTRQMAWLDEHRWAYELDARGRIIVGTLYAHLRLAGLAPTGTQATAQKSGGFNLEMTR